MHPDQVAATRARLRVSGGKSHRFDAFVLSELARTDHHRFRVLERFWPGPIGRFCELDSQVSLAFLEHYPSPADARSLGEKREIFLSLFRSRRSVITAATMPAEIGDRHARYPTRDALAGDAGAAR